MKRNAIINRTATVVKPVAVVCVSILFISALFGSVWSAARAPDATSSSSSRALLSVGSSDSGSGHGRSGFPFDDAYFDLSSRKMKNKKMLLGILSYQAEKPALRRQLIRETYLRVGQDERDGRICQLRRYQKLVDRGRYEEADECIVLYCFVVTHAAHDDVPSDHYRTDRPLTVDRRTIRTHQVGDVEHDDLVYLNIRENMNDGKTPAYFKWAASIATEYNLDYVFKVDDDTMISVPHLFRHVVDRLPPYPFNKRYYGGRILDVNMCGKSKRCHYISPNGYMAGQFYYLSPDLAHGVSNDDLDPLPDTRTEDLDMGRAVFRWSDVHGQLIKIETHGRKYKPWEHPVKDPAEWTRLWNAFYHDGVSFIHGPI